MTDAEYSIPPKKLPPGAEVHLSDTTLRDGSQMPGIFMSPSHKLRIFDYFHRIGIEKVECFVFSESDRATVERMLERGYEHPAVTGWVRANKEDIDAVTRVEGIRETGILMSVSDLHIFKKIGFASRRDAERSYLDALSYALEKGLAVRCHLEDVTRSDFSGFVVPLVRRILAIAPEAIIRVCDTVGIGLPDPAIEPPRGIPRLVRALKDLGVRHIETHMHDDLGNAVANSLAGFDHGADWTSAAFLGIGERAGNAAMEEILVNLHFTEGLRDRYDLGCLTELAHFMETELGIAVPGNKAVVGKNVFVHRSGIHGAAVIRDPRTYEPFSPELIGAQRSLVAGPTSGLEIVAYKVNEVLAARNVGMTLSKDDPRIQAIFEEVRGFYDGRERRQTADVSPEEMEALVRKHIG